MVGRARFERATNWLKGIEYIRRKALPHKGFSKICYLTDFCLNTLSMII